MSVTGALTDVWPEWARVPATACEVLGVPDRAGGERVARAHQGPACAACNLPFAPPAPEDLALFQTARHAGKDARKAMAPILRKKLSELGLGTFEKSYDFREPLEGRPQ